MKFVAWLVVGDDAAEERAEARDWEDQRGRGARRTKAQRGGNGGALVERRRVARQRRSGAARTRSEGDGDHNRKAARLRS